MTVRLDADFWSARMAFLGKLARADGIAVVLEVKNEGFVTYASDNIPSDPGWNGAVAGPLIRSTFESRRAGQASVVLPLADGRATSTIFVAPIIWNDQLVGALATLRTAGMFDDRDMHEIERVADLVGLELAEATALRRVQSQHTDLETRLRAHTRIADVARSTRDPEQLLERATAQLAELFGADGVSIMLADDSGQLSVRSSLGLTDAAKKDRKQALVLYELSRLATRGNDPEEDLGTAAEMIAGMLNNDVVGVWALEPSGLRFRAGHGYPEPRPGLIPLAGLGPAMTMAVRQQQLATARFAAGDERRPDWAFVDAQAFVLAPIGSHGNYLGALVLGRKT